MVKSETAVLHAVVNPDQKTGLSPVDTFENGNEVLYFTRQKGDYQVIVQRKQEIARLQFCAYQGEGE